MSVLSSIENARKPSEGVKWGLSLEVALLFRRITVSYFIYSIALLYSTQVLPITWIYFDKILRFPRIDGGFLTTYVRKLSC